jgi:hypothetical protein
MLAHGGAGSLVVRVRASLNERVSAGVCQPADPFCHGPTQPSESDVGKRPGRSDGSAHALLEIRSCINVDEELLIPTRLQDASKQAMTEERQKPWLRGRLETALVRGLTRAYETVRVDPAKYLLQLRAAYDLPIAGFRGVYQVEIGYLDEVASSVIRSSMKIAALQGAGFGLGGIMTLIPDMGVLSAITMRTIQKLSLVYGFEFNTEEEMAEFWIAAASAAGVDISRELLEKEVVNRFVPKVIQRIAVQASAEVVEKWAGRLIPVASSLIGAGLNYYFVRTWAERARAHFRKKHLEVRGRLASEKRLPQPAASATADTL